MSRALFQERMREAEAAVEADLQILERGGELSDPLEFAARYRGLASTLSIARHRRYDSALVDRLNALVVRAHTALYAARIGRSARDGLSVLLFEFPRRVRALPGPLLLSVLCFFGTYLAAFTWVRLDPQAAYALMPASYLDGLAEMYDPKGRIQTTERTLDDDLTMFGFYVWNNVGIAFRTFGASLFLGVGSILALVFNGLYIGVGHAHVVERGFGESFHAFVLGHSAFELFAIVLAGLAGFHVGFAFLRPGLESRSRAVLLRAREVLPILWGAFAMLLIAAAIEAFFSPRDLPFGVKLAVGSVNAVGLLSFFAFSGRETRAPR